MKESKKLPNNKEFDSSNPSANSREETNKPKRLRDYPGVRVIYDPRLIGDQLKALREERKANESGQTSPRSIMSDPSVRVIHSPRLIGQRMRQAFGSNSTKADEANKPKRLRDYPCVRVIYSPRIIWERFRAHMAETKEIESDQASPDSNPKQASGSSSTTEGEA